MTMNRATVGDTVLRNLHVPATLLDGFSGSKAEKSGLVPVDLAIRDGRFFPAVPGKDGQDMGGRILLPGFVDMHVHIDKAYTVHRTGFSQRGLGHAVELSMSDSPNRTVDDMIERMERSLVAAEKHGTVAMRTHLDTLDAPEQSPAWIAYGEMKRAWKGRIKLQAVALMALSRVEEEAFAHRCAQVAERGGILGAFIDTKMATPERLDIYLGHAMDHGLDLDLHLDETVDPDADGLGRLLEGVVRKGYQGRIVAGHCCALAQKTVTEQNALIAKVAEAGVHVVSLPLSNGFLQDRAPHRTKRMVGLAPVQELAAAGVNVAFASDNVRDAFYPYGTYDMLEVQRSGTFLGQLEADPGRWIEAVTRAPALAMGLADAGCIRAGGPADGVIFEAWDWADLYSGIGLERSVFRGGRMLSAAAGFKTREHA
ncbi:Cytosine deaminase [Thalassovita gelatinovora]|uniref:Cytosine deaminase n=1 Tax=Thalassovita gelatinovora TaxID=53501 RepID=A0A0P1FWB2_THAGE|nr:amidohydrolase family protein [Thalassovita gelatinovora]QIZ79177.1 amidohydrolase family protein [Thalassovita gelatinovora]CUH63646.1 Cytosine deaminase [Thalassovita gelatinovora]SER00908.1 cytosine deaminase [Thalassovita gelatinovora]